MEKEIKITIILKEDEDGCSIRTEDNKNIAIGSGMCGYLNKDDLYDFFKAQQPNFFATNKDFTPEPISVKQGKFTHDTVTALTGYETKKD